MRYVVYGAGGVGSLLGARLAAAGESVLLVGRPEHVARIEADGLRIVEVDGSTTVARLPAATAPLAPGRDDLIVLTVKSQDTRAALRELRRHYRPETPIVCLQNGVRNEAAARRSFERVYGGLNVIGAQYLTPGVVEALGPKALAVGRYRRGSDRTAEAVVAAASRAGLTASVNPDVMAAKWTKLIGNLHNAVFALCDLTVAATYDDPDGCALVQRLRDEAVAVLRAAGVAHDPVGPVGPPGSMPRNPVPMYGSTWMDFKRGRPRGETDYFNGEIVRLGSRHGMPTPANAAIVRLASAAVRRRAGPGGHTLAELRALAEE
jgi:2-dehydropantoate 2-reductase